MRDWALRNPAKFTLAMLIAAFASGFLAGHASAAPVSVHVHQDNLYGGTRAEVRVYTTIKARRPGTATIQVEPLDTRQGNWATQGPATTARVRLRRGTNRIHKSLSVEMLEDRFCAWQEAFRADHPECPRLAGFRDPYVRVAVPFDRVFVTVAGSSIQGRDRIASVHQLNGPAARERSGPGRRDTGGSP